ncbi:MAG: glycerate kinase [Propionibacteriaceae bacterium]|jgi:glycerate kinase|nr:glycerate kinase [Propionibacteriaceae bacterium]
MKIVLAPDSFKESMSAPVAAAAMARGVRQVFPDAECLEVPMADGGEGTTEALLAGLGGQWREVATVNALGEPITARYGLTADGTAVIESAASNGLGLIPPERRNIMASNTVGVAALMRDAFDAGAQRLVMGLGGSATNDCGAGLLVGLGAKLLDAGGAEVAPLPAELDKVARIDLSGVDPRVAQVPVKLACDVTNPLLGPNGASAVFGPQKGATPELVQVLDAKLAVFADALEAATGLSLREHPGAGAAGGLGAAFLALRAQMNRGVALVVEASRLEEKLAGATLCFTGEGSLDEQTLSGKTPAGVAEAATKAGVPCVAFTGRLGPGAEKLVGNGFAAVVPILPGLSDLPTALAEGEANLERSVATAMRLLALSGAT